MTPLIKRCIALLLLFFPLIVHGAKQTIMDFSTLQKPKTNNYFLLCPADLCRSMKPNAITPVFSVDRDTLEKTTLALLKRQARTTLAQSHPARHQYQFIQRSFWFRFPDIITIEFISVDDKHATFAMFSKAKYGHSDFGVNRKRVLRWLRRIEQHPDIHAINR